VICGDTVAVIVASPKGALCWCSDHRHRVALFTEARVADVLGTVSVNRATTMTMVATTTTTRLRAGDDHATVSRRSRGTPAGKRPLHHQPSSGPVDTGPSPWSTRGHADAAQRRIYTDHRCLPGDGNFQGSNGNTISQTVTRATATTTVARPPPTRSTARRSSRPPRRRTAGWRYRDGHDHVHHHADRRYGFPDADHAGQRVATLMPPLNVGTYSITATYSGDTKLPGQ